MDGSEQTTGGQASEPVKDDLSTHGHRQMIGSVGLLLPVLLWLIAGWRPSGNDPWAPLNSISAYYYSGSVSAFAGMLIALALFLFTYRGYNNAFYRRDRATACIAGLAAMVVALFPTGAPIKSLELAWWTPRIGLIHYGGAAVLFSCFIFFCLFQFPMTSQDKSKALPRDKQARNIIYYACGVGIIACMAWAVYANSVAERIFWPESVALEFFAISWLVKGRVDQTAKAAGRKTMRYARNPRRLVKDVQRAAGRPKGLAAPQKQP